MKKSKFSSPYYAKDYFTKDILPSEIYAGQKTIRQPIPYRRHDEIEIMLVRSGEGSVTVNGDRLPIRRGSLLCFSPTHFHKLDPDKNGRLEVSECHINAGVYLYITACPYYSPASDTMPVPPVLAQLDETLTERAEQVMEELSVLCDKAPISENQSAFFLLMKLFGFLERFHNCTRIKNT